MAAGAAHALEEALARGDGGAKARIPWDHLPGHRQRGLEQRDRGHVGAGELVHEAVAVVVDARAETLLRLDAVMLIEGAVVKSGND